tara:strand:- start:460 stop:765 length:306 start_codon:yes stop_codon:yes gene_type:complete
LNNNQFSPDAISHKELTTFLNNAKKDLFSIETSNETRFKDDQEFSELISNWTLTSKKMLSMLQKRDTLKTKNISPKSLLAFGAMGAHINMALQALKATELD